jgi:hypothetical protein
MTEAFTTWIAWPALPFTVLLGLVVLYWLLVLLGAFEIDLLDVDFDHVMEAKQASLADWGMMGVKWFNLGDVPLMVWLTVLALASWLITLTFDRNLENPTTGELAVVIARNFGLGLLAAKVITQPLKGKLKHKEPTTAREMLGRTCVITTSEATAEFGYADCQIEDGAPLKLNVRAVADAIPKGATARIIDYSPETGIYYIEPVNV